MATTHTLKYNGYKTSAERLLEGVIFDVTIVDDGNTVTVGDVAPSESAKDYLKSIRWERFVPEIRKHVEGNLAALKPEYEREGLTFSRWLDAAEQDPGWSEPAIQAVMEV